MSEDEAYEISLLMIDRISPAGLQWLKDYAPSYYEEIQEIQAKRSKREKRIARHLTNQLAPEDTTQLVEQSAISSGGVS